MWLLFFSIIVIYLYLSTHKLWHFLLALSIMVGTICFFNGWDLMDFFNYIEETVRPILESLAEFLEKKSESLN